MNKISEIHKYIVCLIPFFLITGPFLSDLSIVISSLLFLYFCVNKKLYHYFNNIFFIIFFLLCIYLIFLSLISDYPSNSLSSSLFYFRFGLFALSIQYLLDTSDNFINLFFYSILICLSLLVFDTYFQYFVGFNILGFEPKFANDPVFGEGEARRLSGLLKDELKLGSLISRLIPILLGLFYFLKHKKLIKIKTIYMAIFFLFSFFAVFLIGERSAFFYMIMTFFVFLIFGQFKKKYVFYLLLLVVFSLSSISILDKGTRDRMINSTISQSSFDFNKVLKDKIWKDYDNLNINIFSPHHSAHYISAYKMFKSKPFFGVGPKNFRILCNDEKYYVKFSCSTHPHNTYAQLLSETGVFLTLFIFLIFVYIVFFFIKNIYILMFKNIYIDRHNIFFMLSLLISLWPFIPTGSFFNNWLSIIYFLPLGFILHFMKYKNRFNAKY